MKTDYQSSGKLIKFSTQLLKKVNIKRGRYEASIIMSDIIKKKLYEIITNPEININEYSRKIFLKKVYQRFTRKPLSRILGRREFYSRDFFINKYVLDPRPESEIIVDLVKLIHSQLNKRLVKILELGTGSGCLIISILKEIYNKKTFALATDTSIKALQIAEKNIYHHKLSDRIRVLQSDWFSDVHEKFDIIISNPPYIESKDIKNLDLSVRDHDPLLSLDGGDRGLNCYKSIARHAKKYLNNQGSIILEIGNNQRSSVCSIFKKEGFKAIIIKKDLLNHYRAIVFKNIFE